MGARVASFTDGWQRGVPHPPIPPTHRGAFSRIERWTRTSDGDTHWRSISKDNVTTLYGKRETGSDPVQSRIYDQRDHSRVFSWLVSESYDDKGNATSYEYKMENSQNVELSPAHECNRTEGMRRANRYLKRIKYGNRTPRQPNEDLSLRKDWVFEVVFDYGEHYTEDKHGYPTSVFLTDDQRHWPIRQDPFSVTAPVSRCAREKVVFDPWRHETWDVADTLTLEPQHDASGNAAQPYVALRHAAGHLTMIANPLADAIAKQFPAKYTI